MRSSRGGSVRNGGRGGGRGRASGSRGGGRGGGIGFGFGSGGGGGGNFDGYHDSRPEYHHQDQYQGGNYNNNYHPTPTSTNYPPSNQNNNNNSYGHHDAYQHNNGVVGTVHEVTYSSLSDAAEQEQHQQQHHQSMSVNTPAFNAAAPAPTPLMFTPIVDLAHAVSAMTHLEFPTVVRDALMADGMRNLLLWECVATHDVNCLQNLRDSVPTTDWDGVLRQMRISMMLFAVADVEYFQKEAAQLSNVLAVLNGSIGMWSVHPTLSGAVSQVHSFLRYAVPRFHKGNYTAPQPQPPVQAPQQAASQPQTQAPSQPQQAPSQPQQPQPQAPVQSTMAPPADPVNTVPATHADDPHGEIVPPPPLAVSTPAKPTSTPSPHPATISQQRPEQAQQQQYQHSEYQQAQHAEQQNQQHQQQQQQQQQSHQPNVASRSASVFNKSKTAWVDVDRDGRGENHFIMDGLTNARFTATRLPNLCGQLNSGADLPHACIFYNQKEKLDFRTIGRYVELGGVFVYFGDRHTLEEEQRGFPNLTWEDRSEVMCKPGRVTTIGSDYLPSHPRAVWNSKCMWMRDIPRSEALVVAVEPHPTDRNHCSMAFHQHGKGAYVYVGDFNLGGFPMNLISNLLSSYANKILQPTSSHQQQDNHNRGGSRGSGSAQHHRDQHSNHHSGGSGSPGPNQYGGKRERSPDTRSHNQHSGGYPNHQNNNSSNYTSGDYASYANNHSY